MSGDFRKFPEIEQIAEDWCVQPRLVYRAPVLPSLDLCSLIAPIATCCEKRRVTLAMTEHDRSEFTREAFGGI